MGLLSMCIGFGTPLGALEMGAVASLLALQPAIALNALAGLALLVPAIAITPLVKRELSQPPPAPVTR